MKHLFSLLILCFLGFSVNAQFGISYHQSAIPFIGFNYTINERLMPELRLGTNLNFDYIPIEGVFTYNFVHEEEYRLYAGLGFYYYSGQGAASFPVGVQIYPFEKKRFGFHIEATPLLGEGIRALRGSWGIRYQFFKE